MSVRDKKVVRDYGQVYSNFWSRLGVCSMVVSADSEVLTSGGDDSREVKQWSFGDVGVWDGEMVEEEALVRGKGVPYEDSLGEDYHQLKRKFD